MPHSDGSGGGGALTLRGMYGCRQGSCDPAVRSSLTASSGPALLAGDTWTTGLISDREAAGLRALQLSARGREDAAPLRVRGTGHCLAAADLLRLSLRTPGIPEASSLDSGCCSARRRRWRRDGGVSFCAGPAAGDRSARAGCRSICRSGWSSESFTRIEQAIQRPRETGRQS